MNASEVESLVRELARDLRLSNADHYELTSVARRFAQMDDAEMNLEAQKLATRATSSVLGGAVLLAATGIREQRFTAFLSPGDRAEYEQRVTIGGSSSAADDEGG